MAIVVAWDNEEKTVIRCDIIGSWDFTQASAAMREVAALIDSVDYPVAVIDDFTQSNSMLPNNIMLNGRRLVDTLHPRISVIVIVAASTFLRTVHNAFRRVYPQAVGRISMAESLEAGRALIAQRQADGQ